MDVFNDVNSEEEQSHPKRAAIYARVSSGAQARGYSLDEQIRLCRKRCEQNGWIVRYVFREDGISARNTDRPKFQIMLQKARSYCFDVLVFWKIDRFARSLRDIVNIQKELEDHNISILSLTEPFDTSTAVGKFTFRNLASAAELESSLIQERSRMGMRALAMQGKWPNRLPPLGFDKNADGYLEVNQEEASLVRIIFKRYLSLRSMAQLAFELNAEGHLTKRGRPWSATTIKGILDNELYIGHYLVAEIEKTFDALTIVDKDLFKQASMIRNSYKKTDMPKTRKQWIVDKMMNNYHKYLDDVFENADQQVAIDSL